MADTPIALRPVAAPVGSGGVRPQPIQDSGDQQRLKGLSALSDAVNRFSEHQLQRDVENADNEAATTLEGMTLDEARAKVKAGEMDTTESPFFRAALSKAYGQRLGNARIQAIHDTYNNDFDKLYGNVDEMVKGQAQVDLDAMGNNKFAKIGYSQTFDPQAEKFKAAASTERSTLVKAQALDNLKANTISLLENLPPGADRGAEAHKRAYGMLNSAQETFGYDNPTKDSVLLSVGQYFAGKGDGNTDIVNALLSDKRPDGTPGISTKVGEQGAQAMSIVKAAEDQRRKFTVESDGVERAGLSGSAAGALGWQPGMTDDQKSGARDGFIQTLEQRRRTNLINGEEEQHLLASWDASVVQKEKAHDDDTMRKLVQDWKDGLVNQSMQVLQAGGGFNPEHAKTVFEGHENNGYYEFTPEEHRQLLKDRLDEGLKQMAAKVTAEGGNGDAAYYAGMAKFYSQAGMKSEALTKTLADASVMFRDPSAVDQKELNPAQQKALTAFQTLRAVNPGFLDQHMSGDTLTYWTAYNRAREYMQSDDLRSLQEAGTIVNSEAYRKRINDPEDKKLLEAQTKSDLNSGSWLFGLFGDKRASNADEIENQVSQLALMYSAAGGMNLKDAIRKGADRVAATHANVNGRLVYKVGQDNPADFSASAVGAIKQKLLDGGIEEKKADALSKTVTISPNGIGRDSYLLWDTESNEPLVMGGKFVPVTTKDLWDASTRVKQAATKAIIDKNVAGQNARAADATRRTQLLQERNAQQGARANLSRPGMN